MLRCTQCDRLQHDSANNVWYDTGNKVGQMLLLLRPYLHDPTGTAALSGGPAQPGSHYQSPEQCVWLKWESHKLPPNWQIPLEGQGVALVLTGRAPPAFFANKPHMLTAYTHCLNVCDPYLPLDNMDNLEMIHKVMESFGFDGRRKDAHHCIMKGKRPNLAQRLKKLSNRRMGISEKQFFQVLVEHCTDQQA